MQALIAVVAALAGIGLGFWLRSAAAKGEKAAAANDRAQLAQRNAELAAELAGVRTEVAQIREIAERRAGFESLCAERAKTIEDLQRDLRLKSASEQVSLGRVKELEAELRSEQQKVQERDVFLEKANAALGDHFQTLASNILDQKSKALAESSQKDLNTLLSPLKNDIQQFRAKVEEAQRESLVGRTELAGELKNLK